MNELHEIADTKIKNLKTSNFDIGAWLRLSSVTLEQVNLVNRRTSRLEIRTTRMRI